MMMTNLLGHKKPNNRNVSNPEGEKTMFNIRGHQHDDEALPTDQPTDGPTDRPSYDAFLTRVSKSVTADIIFKGWNRSNLFY